MRSDFARGLLVALVAAAAGLAAGCSSSPPPRLYVLVPLTPPAAAADAAEGLAVGVGPVTLAPHLDRPQIVTRRGSEIHLGELDRWAEPLPDGIARSLAENLGSLLATDRVWTHPWRPSVPIDYQVSVDVLRFDDEGAAGVLAARFTLSKGGAVFATRRFERREPAASPGAAATVEALSRALAELSREIARAMSDHAASAGSPLPG